MDPITQQPSQASSFDALANTAINARKSFPQQRPYVSTPAMIQPGNNYESSQPAQYPNILKGLGMETTKYGGSTRYEKFHPGVDIANKIGTPIPFLTGGIVTEIQGGKKQGEKGYGNYVKIKDPQGNIVQYSHLMDTSGIRVGENVQPGQKRIAMGNTGSTYSTSGGTGSHLDLRIYNAYKKMYVDPYAYLKKLYG